jgi:RNA polymerase sigma-70 factor (ECF subfamily)
MRRERNEFDQSGSDADLVGRAVRGDREAFGDLYERYLDEIYRYLYFRVADEVEVEDMTEMVFLKAWEVLPRTDEPIRNIRAWLYRVAHNLLVDRHRTHKASLSLDVAANRPDAEPPPEAAVEQREAAERMARMVSQLKPREQQVLLCRFVSGLSHSETAEVLNLRENHVRVLQFRALKALRKRFGQELECDE